MEEQVKEEKATLSVTIKELLEAGAHFGHQKNRWNPKMKRFIFEERDGLYIIDLAKTLQQIRNVVKVVEEVVENYGSILFVGTKKQAKIVVKDCAENCKEFYICERWLGGMLTNLSTIRQSVKKLENMEKTLLTGGEGLTKKEISLLTKEKMKLDRYLSGVRSMRKLPKLLIVVDAVKEHTAIAEANKLGIPVMGLIDTNADPDVIQYPIACNDDALKSIRLILNAITQTIINKKKEMEVFKRRKREEAQKMEPKQGIEKEEKNLEQRKRQEPKKAEESEGKQKVQKTGFVKMRKVESKKTESKVESKNVQKAEPKKEEKKEEEKK